MSTVTQEPGTTLPGWTDMLRPVLGATAVGVLLCAVGAFVMPGQLFRSYLVAFLYWLGIGLGSLAILMVQYQPTNFPLWTQFQTLVYQSIVD